MDRNQGVRLSELVASLSLATDVGMGQPMDHALRTCLLALGAARELGLSEEECREVYYLALLRFVGCNAHAQTDALESGGDEIAFRAGIAPILTGETTEFMAHLFRHLAEGSPRLTRAKLIAAALATGPGGARRTIKTTCEVAQMMARRLGLGETVVHALGFTFEYHNGKGMPNGVKGDEIPATTRVAIVARDVEVLPRIGGWALAEETLRKRRGRAYHPSVADAFLLQGQNLLAAIEERPAWEAVVEADPTAPYLTGERLDEVLRCFADFADLKSLFTRGHSPAVSQLASKAAESLGLSKPEIDAVRTAGLLQELGKTGVPNGILDKPGSLTSSEWERLRLNPYLTERIVSRSPSMSEVASLAGAHHERMNGSGYHRGSRGNDIPIGSRILAAADAYRAMTSERPYRPAFEPQDAGRTLREEAAAGRLDPRAVEGVLEAAGEGGGRPRSRHAWPAGLSDREVEVLRLISLGRSNREVADVLVISPKTVGRHVENIYAKIGVSTRPAAALFAMQHHLLAGD